VKVALYYGESGEAAALTRDVRERITAEGNRVSASSVLAAAVEALALAQVGDVAASESALSNASQSFDRLDSSQQAESVFGFSKRRLLFYRSRTISLYGQLDRAWEAQEQALALYPREVVGDPTIIRLDRAAALIRSGDIKSGSELASHTLLSMPTRHRTKMFLDCAAAVVDAIDRSDESVPSVRELRDLVTDLRNPDRGGLA
jgi:hypothetical protein